jgi:hypothetical protein
MEELDYSKFVSVDFKDLKINDLVKTVTMTYSQKYMLYIGYEEYNMTKIGYIKSLNYENNSYSRIIDFEDKNKEMNLYSDPGNSGFVSIYKYVE